MIKEGKEQSKIDKLTTQLVSHEATLGFLKDTLREIADEDYRGNRSNASVKAYQVLKKIGAYKEEK
jgi:predicted KAP-like P-loop ATPase